MPIDVSAAELSAALLQHPPAPPHGSRPVGAARHVRIFVPDRDGCPADLRDGLRHLAQHHTVRGLLVVASDGAPDGASDRAADGSQKAQQQQQQRPATQQQQQQHQEPPTQLWHLRFVQSSDIPPRTLSINAIPITRPAAPRSSEHAAGYSHSRSHSHSHSQFEVVVRYSRPIEAFRALGRIITEAHRLAARLASAESASDSAAAARLVSSESVMEQLSIQESCQFETLGLMIDCSRGAVATVATVGFWLRNCALMGINMVMLYTEDTYTVDGEPFFGYQRGAYSEQELRAIDDRAFSLGIEVVPCIQTLGHLGQVLQWPRYASLRDTNEVILAGADESYALIERMVRAITGPLRSRRIHIGMDEAHYVGEGRYRQVFGARDPKEIFVDHLQRVCDICAEQGLQPLIWSDMLFCLAAGNNALAAYYDTNNDPALDGTSGPPIPRGVELVFWDYYHVNAELYSRKLQQHRTLGCPNPWMAGGAWTWSRMWCSLPFTLSSTQASMVAAKDPGSGVRTYVLTIWGDEGNECDTVSALPALLYIAHQGYTPQVDMDRSLFDDSFAALCSGADASDWVAAAKLDDAPPPSLSASGNGAQLHPELRFQLPPNLSRWLLWEDPLIALVSPQHDDIDLERHFGGIAAQLSEAVCRSVERNSLNLRLLLPLLLARTLALKVKLRGRLAAAYKAGDTRQLDRLLVRAVRPLVGTATLLWRYHRAMWHATFKPFGWEVIELRYGGLLARLKTLRDRLEAYVGMHRSGGGGGKVSASLSASRGTSVETTAAAASEETASPSSPTPSAMDIDAAAHSGHSVGEHEDGNEDNGGDDKLAAADRHLTCSELEALVAQIEARVHDINSGGDFFPELSADLHRIYEHSRTSLMLDYNRVSTPSRT